MNEMPENMTVGRLRQMLADIPDEVACCLLVPAGFGRDDLPIVAPVAVEYDGGAIARLRPAASAGVVTTAARESAEGLGAVELLSLATNACVVRTPGRNYPGVVVQGDSLAVLCDLANRVALALREQGLSEDAQQDAQDVLDALVARLLHYQNVLAERGIPLPYGGPRRRSDFVEGHDTEAAT